MQVMRQRTTARTPWRSLVPAELCGPYERVENALATKYGNTETARTATNYLCHFTMLFNGGGADLAALTACSEDADRALTVWQDMQNAGKWSSKHTILVRTTLARALSEVSGRHTSSNSLVITCAPVYD